MKNRFLKVVIICALGMMLPACGKKHEKRNHWELETCK